MSLGIVALGHLLFDVDDGHITSPEIWLAKIRDQICRVREILTRQYAQFFFTRGMHNALFVH